MSQAKFAKNDRVVRTERIGSGESLKELTAAGRVTGVDRNGVEILFDDAKMGKSWVPNRLVKLESAVIAEAALKANGHGSKNPIVTKIPLGTIPTGAPKIGVKPTVGSSVFKTIAERAPISPLAEIQPAPKSYDEMTNTAAAVIQTHMGKLHDEIAALQDMAKGLITKAEHAVAEAKRERERRRQEVVEAQNAFIEAEKAVEMREVELRRVMQYAGPR